MLIDAHSHFRYIGSFRSQINCAAAAMKICQFNCNHLVITADIMACCWRPSLFCTTNFGQTFPGKCDWFRELIRLSATARAGRYGRIPAPDPARVSGPCQHSG
jgi:hypothetical protein